MAEGLDYHENQETAELIGLASPADGSRRGRRASSIRPVVPVFVYLAIDVVLGAAA